MNPVAQQVAIVTGAAGTLGRAITTALVADGWQVMAGVHRSPIEAAERVVPMPLDVTSVGQIDAAVERVMTEFGRLDAWIHCAGIVRDDLIFRQTEADWDAVLAVNLRAAFLGARAALKPMLKQRRGHIVNVGSFAGHHGAPGQAAYSAAKAGLHGLTQSLAREVGSRNVRINTVLPGLLAGPMTAGLSAERLDALRAQNALGRLNRPEEVARFIAHLLTMQDVSGQVFQLDSRVAN
jgi:3-oxoacyl-[acyl-carrier protein] reductase